MGGSRPYGEGLVLYQAVARAGERIGVTKRARSSPANTHNPGTGARYGGLLFVPMQANSVCEIPITRSG